jgi:hypothetical protein
MSPRTTARFGRAFVLAAIVAAAASSACSSPPPDTTGFLGDYSGFDRAPDRDTAWIWRKAGADLRDYDKLMFDPVVVQPAPGSRLAQLEKGLAASRADELYQAMASGVAPYHTVVLTSGPHTLRVRLALTELALGTATTPGTVGIEAELVDSKSNERIAAVVERLEMPPAADPAAPVRAAFQTWTGRLVDFLETHGAK